MATTLANGPVPDLNEAPDGFMSLINREYLLTAAAEALAMAWLIESTIGVEGHTSHEVTPHAVPSEGEAS
jgi:hypothetical protein